MKTFLLIARKHLSITGHSEYYIGTNPENPSKNLNEENSLAKLKGINIKGSEYILYDQQNSSNKDNQSAAIIYVNHQKYKHLFLIFFFSRMIIYSDQKNQEN